MIALLLSILVSQAQEADTITDQKGKTLTVSDDAPELCADMGKTWKCRDVTEHRGHWEWKEDDLSVSSSGTKDIKENK